MPRPSSSAHYDSDAILNNKELRKNFINDFFDGQLDGTQEALFHNLEQTDLDFSEEVEKHREFLLRLENLGAGAYLESVGFFDEKEDDK